jgi:TonB family protein
MKNSVSLSKTLLFAAVSFFVLVSVQSACSQTCALRVGAWEAGPPAKGEYQKLYERKTILEHFTATATNTSTKRSYPGVSVSGYVIFDKIPEGSYALKLRKTGFKTSVQMHDFSCAYIENGFDFVDVQMEQGSPQQTLSIKSLSIPPRDPNKYTVRGDVGYRPDSQLPSPAKRPPPKVISGGVLNGKATYLPKPEYPADIRVTGAVQVQVLVDESGRVVSASAAGGHPLLQAAAVAAARQAIFAPTFLAGSPVKVSGIITYNFVP